MYTFVVYLKEKKISVNYEKYTRLCEDLLGEFKIRFSDFRKIEIELKLFNDPFSFDMIKHQWRKNFN